MRKLTTLAAAIAATSISATALAEKWDMPMAYAATNFHSEMGVVFADKVRDYTKGEIDITVHPGGSLFKGGEIKRQSRLDKHRSASALCQPTRTKHPYLAGIISIPCDHLRNERKVVADCKRQSQRTVSRSESGDVVYLPMARTGLLLQQGGQLRS